MMVVSFHSKILSANNESTSMHGYPYHYFSSTKVDFLISDATKAGFKWAGWLSTIYLRDVRIKEISM